MPIVSISLNDEILSELDKLQSSMGFTGRSEAIRAGIRAFVSEEKQKADLSGNIHAILLVVHNDEFDHVVSGITHNFEDLITTHLHSKIDKEKCMELFVIDGDAEKVSTMTKRFSNKQEYGYSEVSSSLKNNPNAENFQEELCFIIVLTIACKFSQ